MTSKPKKVLIVEDERPMAKILHMKLKKENIDSDIAHNGEEGLELLSENKYDLIVLDLIMPKMNGFAFLEEMKAQKVSTKVIVASNLSQAGDLEKSKELGAVDYFVKSNTSLVDLVSRIKKFLEK